MNQTRLGASSGLTQLAAQQLLQAYAGTLFLVSHDRTFLDNVVTQTIAPEGQGGWREYAGGYQDWADYQAARRAEAAQAESSKRAASAANTPVAEKTRADGKRKLSYKESRELEELPGRIAALEAEQQSITQQLADPALYQTQPQEAATLSSRLTDIDDELMHLLERWEALEA